MATQKSLTVGIMGPGSSANAREIRAANDLGYKLAMNKMTVLTGGVNTGVMHAALKGAKGFRSDSRTIGILPHRGDPEQTSEFADIIIATGMGEGRNSFNILASNVVIVCCDNPWASYGTMIELILALKYKKPLICLHTEPPGESIYNEIIDRFPITDRHPTQLVCDNTEDAMSIILGWRNAELL